MVKEKSWENTLSSLFTVCNVSLFPSSEPVLIAKSNIILDVKPWDDETDMAKLEECVRSITMDGLLWGACKLQLSVSSGDT